MNNDGVFVKLGSNTVTNYTVDYRNEPITFATAPLRQVLSIVVVGESATKIPDINNFVADGSTNTFVTNVTWVDNATHFVNIYGESLSTLFKTDSTYGDDAGLIAIQFNRPQKW